MILADVGNRHAHIWNEGKIEHLLLVDAIEKYGKDKVYYINVSTAHAQTLAVLETWIDVEAWLSIEGEYEGMGIDRKALCHGHANAVLVDAGSAITVDKVEDGIYQGGCIVPGLHTYSKAYASISPILDVEIDPDVRLDVLPKSTQDSVSYGAVAPIVASIEKISQGLPVYCTGSDGARIAKYLDQAVYDEALLFQGMLKMIKKVEKC